MGEASSCASEDAWAGETPPPRGMLGVMRASLPRGGTLPAEAWNSRHRWLTALLWLHAVGLAIFAYSSGLGLSHSLFEGAIPAAFAVAAALAARRRILAVSTVAIGLMSCSAILVHISGGYIEAHFHFFVMIVVLT